MVNNVHPSGSFVIGDRALRDLDDAFPHPDWCAGYGQAGRYTVVGASALGRMHQDDGTPRDDAFAARLDGDWLAVAVADGVGSRPQSRYGAALCVERLCDHLLRGVTRPTGTAVVGSSGSGGAMAEDTPPVAARSPTTRTVSDQVGAPSPAAEPAPDWSYAGTGGHAGTLLWNRPQHAAAGPIVTVDANPVDLRELLRSAFTTTRKDLDQFADENNLHPRDLACTLLGIVLHTDTGYGAGGHIGDGVLVVDDAERGPRLLVTPLVPDEPGAIYPFSDRRWTRYLAIAPITPAARHDLPSVLLMTDGVSDDHRRPPPEGVFERACREIQAQLGGLPPRAAAMKLLRWLATYTAPASFDDRTLVAVLAERDTPADQMPPASEGASDPTADTTTAADVSGVAR